MEIWVQGNRRAYLAGALLLLLLEAFCLCVALDRLSVPMLPIARMLATLVAVIALPVLVLLGVHYRLPRLAYKDGQLLVYVGGLRPTHVPIEFVEVFFIGQGMAGANVAGSRLQAANLVVRLAERAQVWHARDMRSTFGTWKDGYISLSGVWCEPIDAPLLHALNRRLVEKKKDIQLQR